LHETLERALRVVLILLRGLHVERLSYRRLEVIARLVHPHHWHSATMHANWYVLIRFSLGVHLRFAVFVFRRLTRVQGSHIHAR